MGYENTFLKFFTPGTLFSTKIWLSSPPLFENGNFVRGGHGYERRTLRVTVQEQLYPLKLLVKVREPVHVFLDITCGRLSQLPHSLRFAHSPCISFPREVLKALVLDGSYSDRLIHQWCRHNGVFLCFYPRCPLLFHLRVSVLSLNFSLAGAKTVTAVIGVQLVWESKGVQKRGR